MTVAALPMPRPSTPTAPSSPWLLRPVGARPRPASGGSPGAWQPGARPHSGPRGDFPRTERHPRGDGGRRAADVSRLADTADRPAGRGPPDRRARECQFRGRGGAAGRRTGAVRGRRRAVHATVGGVASRQQQSMTPPATVNTVGAGVGTDRVPHVNVEIKARCADPGRPRGHAAASSGARLVGPDYQPDTYFRVPNGRLKLREGQIENNLIFYARPGQDGPKRSDVILYGTRPVLT